MAAGKSDPGLISFCKDILSTPEWTKRIRKVAVVGCGDGTIVNCLQEPLKFAREIVGLEWDKIKLEIAASNIFVEKEGLERDSSNLLSHIW